MLVQFGNNWIQKIPLTAKLDLACGLVQFWLSSEFFPSNYFQIGQACSPISYTNCRFFVTKLHPNHLCDFRWMYRVSVAREHVHLSAFLRYFHCLNF